MSNDSPQENCLVQKYAQDTSTNEKDLFLDPNDLSEFIKEIQPINKNYIKQIDRLLEVIGTQQESLDSLTKHLQVISSQLTTIYKLMELGCTQSNN